MQTPSHLVSDRPKVSVVKPCPYTVDDLKLNIYTKLSRVHKDITHHQDVVTAELDIHLQQHV
jgi:hypothetical protein